MARSRTAKTYVKNDVLFTPPELFEALNLRFDLDVCGPIGGLPWIPANRTFSEQDDGLTQQWSGRVWMNPPYSNPKPWIKKWLSHRNGVALVPCSVGKWFIELWDSEAAGVMLEQAIGFIRPDMDRQLIFMPAGLWAIGETNITALKMSGLGVIR